MTWIPMRVAAVVFLVALSPILISSAQERSNAADAGQAAIKKAVAGYTEALNRHDAHAAAMCFAEDADFVDPNGARAHGRKEIERYFEEAFSNRLRTARRKDSVRSVRFLTPEIAEVDNDWEVTGSRATDGSGVVIPPYKGIHAWVMTMHDGRWLITIFHGVRYPA
jgi:uncharacterized protein (TIGR02246 family)